MATSKAKYIGGLRAQATHLASGNTILTDAPIDNKGKGEAFSPTDLLATSLALCMLTTMGIAADTHTIDMNGAEAEITKIMASGPRRVAEIHVNLTMPQAYNAKQKAILENAAKTCPVALSLNPTIVQKVSFVYPADNQ